MATWDELRDKVTYQRREWLTEFGDSYLWAIIEGDYADLSISDGHQTVNFHSWPLDESLKGRAEAVALAGRLVDEITRYKAALEAHIATLPEPKTDWE